MTDQNFQEQQLALFATMQSILNQIDVISRERGFKFKFKQECNLFYNFLEKKVEAFTATMHSDMEAQNNYVLITQQIDNFAKQIRIIDNRNKSENNEQKIPTDISE